MHWPEKLCILRESLNYFFSIFKNGIGIEPWQSYGEGSDSLWK